jgi:hypothetical protein
LLSKGQYTKNLIQPDEKFQEDLANQVLAIPMTPIVGSRQQQICRTTSLRSQTR